MRILIINHYAYAPSHSAGTRHYELARELIKRGHEVLIVATSFYHKGHKETRLLPSEQWKRELSDGVPFVWLRTPPYSGNSLARIWNMLVFTGRVWSEVGLREEAKPDVVLGSSPHLFAAWAAERLAKRHRVPFVLEVRDLWPQTLVDLGGISAYHPLVRALYWLERYLYRKAACVLTVLPSAADYIVARGASEERVVWLPNGVALDSFPEIIKSKDSQVVTLMYAGAHGLYNGLDTVLEAAELLEQEGWGDRVKIRLVGDGPQKARLQKRLRERGIRIVSFEPPVPKTQIHALLQEADAFLMVLKDAPVFKWGISPNKLFDYMAAERPIIFGAGSSNNPVNDAGAGISVEPGDPKALANGIKIIAQTPPEERMLMGRRGRDYVTEHHCFEKLGEKLEKILSNLIQDDKV